MLRSFIFISFLFFSTMGFSQSDMENLRTQLFDLPNIQFEQIEETKNGLRVNLKIKQWIDHENPSLGHFYQSAVLFHNGFDKNTIMNTNGYSMQMGPVELISLFDANYISIEHRYFGSSNPENRDWRHLNLKNVTADLHHINSLFRKIYDGKWISTGISKSGQTTIYYRYFYPNDVDLSIPYVAPLNRSLADDRIYTFLDNVGDASCREDLYQYQLRLLKKKDEIVPLLYWHSKGAGMSFEYMGNIQKAFEYAVLEYPFSFWQYGSSCETIPDVDASVEAHIDHFNQVVGLSFYSDEMISYYAPHYYQAGTEMGYYSFETDDFEGLIDELSEEPSAIFFPRETEQQFDPEINNKVINWIKNDASGMMFIYGSTDTWTATGAEIGDNEEVHMYMMEDKHHGNARYSQMDEEMQKRFVETAMKYLKDH